ncbi:MAG: Ribosome-recycling factor, partial [Planctomycetota bacterium]
MDIDTTLLEAEDRMSTSVDYFQRELRGMRTGRATTALLEYVKVEYYGSSTDLRELAAINVADATTLLVKPFDPSSKTEIVKAIESAGIGVRAMAEGP